MFQRIIINFVIKFEGYNRIRKADIENIISQKTKEVINESRSI